MHLGKLENHFQMSWVGSEVEVLFAGGAEKNRICEMQVSLPFRVCTPRDIIPILSNNWHNFSILFPQSLFLTLSTWCMAGAGQLPMVSVWNELRLWSVKRTAMPQIVIGECWGLKLGPQKCDTHTLALKDRRLVLNMSICTTRARA